MTILPAEFETATARAVLDYKRDFGNSRNSTSCIPYDSRDIGEIESNVTADILSRKRRKQSMFNLENTKPICETNDKLGRNTNSAGRVRPEGGKAETILGLTKPELSKMMEIITGPYGLRVHLHQIV